MDQRQSTTATDDAAEITLGLLTAVEDNSRLTQRTAADDLGIALGLVNAYLKRCIRKGYVKVTQAPANRYAYYLTPTGFAEKSRLTTEYLTTSLNFFRGARQQCSEVFGECARHGWRRVLLAGSGDLTEIAMLCVDDTVIDLVGILGTASQGRTFNGLPVTSDLDNAPAFDAIVITDFESAQALFDELVAGVPSERVLAPRLLNISRVRPELAE